MMEKAGVMAKLTGTEVFEVTGKLEVTEVPDGFVIYDETGEQVHYLNPTAAVIYTICDGKMPVRDIQAFVREAYDLEEDVELDGFFADLEKAGLVCQAK